jgi:acyl-coenzyme A synthetase/AMP-(fatty) acid ligase
MTYLGQSEDYVAKLDGDWWNMEDIGYRSRWGCLHLVDRQVDQTPGVTSLLEVEDVVLSRLPQLSEIVLIPTAAGATPIVCTHGDERFDRQAWRNATRDLPALGEPLHVRWDRLPRTGTWKVRRLHVRELIERDELEAL